MSKHPLNSAVRLLLEIAALVSFGIWGYHQSDTSLRILLAILMPLGFAVVWGVFAVKDDPSRSGKTVVQTPGILRLLMELGLFGAAAWMMLDLGYSTLAIIFGVTVLVHYILSYDRIAWLLKQK
ncbi:MAG: YrdB family protein, partial [Bacteroidales bacterium]|nr:YrdB family protein [Bacteroidales bacterium]